jgi:LPS sulfotransferase NodH
VRPPRPDSYFICATPRSGSTLLCGLLQSTGVAGRPESYFRLHDEAAWAERWGISRDRAGCFDYRDYVRAAVAAGSTENGLFGARVMWGTVGEMVARLGAAHSTPDSADRDVLSRAFGRIRLIHLWREDTVAQAVSWVRAEQTSCWQQGDVAEPGRRPYFDFARISACLQTIRQHNEGWRNWFATLNVEPHVVTHEELVGDMPGTMRVILEFLGAPFDGEIIPAHQQLADEVNADWISRYRAMSLLGEPG